jgi:hypothetical protein
MSNETFEDTHELHDVLAQLHFHHSHVTADITRLFLGKRCCPRGKTLVLYRDQLARAHLGNLLAPITSPQTLS